MSPFGFKMNECPYFVLKNLISLFLLFSFIIGYNISYKKNRRDVIIIRVIKVGAFNLPVPKYNIEANIRKETG